MKTRLPENAMVKSFRAGEIAVTELKAGDQVIGYDVREKSMQILRVLGVSPIEEKPVLSTFLQNFRWCFFYPETMANTVRGLQALSSEPQGFITYCVVNPMRLTARTPVEYAEVSPTAGVEVEWEGDHYMWAEGLLVGTV